MRPLATRACKMPTEAEEDWMTAVKIIPARIPQKRVAELGHQVNEGFGFPGQGHHGGAHHFHADKQDARAAIIWP